MTDLSTTKSELKDKKISTFSDAEVFLASSLPEYESRPQQQALAHSIEQALLQETHLLAEAGTGTGKSLGYLIPAILSGKRTVISTATKALQDQIAAKDLPFLQQHLNVKFDFALLKGRSNYVCLNKMNNAERGTIPNFERIMQEVERPDFGGTKDDFSFQIVPAEWMHLAADSDDCQIYDCKQNQECWAERAKMKALASQVVVVNHALFLTGLVLSKKTNGKASMIGPYNVVVFDEAHEIEEYAANTLGAQLKEQGVRNLITEVNNFANRYATETAERLQDAGNNVLGTLAGLWQSLKLGRIREADLIEWADEFVEFANALAVLKESMPSSRELNDDLMATKIRLYRVRNKVAAMSLTVTEIVTEPFDNLVRWVEEDRSKRGVTTKSIRTAPINVGLYLAPLLFDTKVTAVLASATLSVNGDFSYIADRLGIARYESIDVGTPFDYQNQALLYVPRHLPEPTPNNRSSWSSMMTAEILELVRVSNGRALLLFTSNAQMKATYEAIAHRIQHACLMQGGQITNKQLAEQFMTDHHSVLFATRSFFTGVDFQGDACSLVVIDKLPFPVPTEPIIEARCDAIKKRGGSDFVQYTIPVMSLTLKQGFGRLIRHRNDRGCVAILDPRLISKPYGKTILKSLPNAVRSEVISEVENFYAKAAS